MPLDFALIVDTSGSISRRNFRKLLDFIEELVDGFDIYIWMALLEPVRSAMQNPPPVHLWADLFV